MTAAFKERVFLDLKRVIIIMVADYSVTDSGYSNQNPATIY